MTDQQKITQRLDALKSHIKDGSFLKGSGSISKENIGIFPYNPSDEMAVRYFIRGLKTERDLNLAFINLYDVFLWLCDDLGILEMIADQESAVGPEGLLNNLQDAITPEDFAQVITKQTSDACEILVIDGVGEVYPFMRLHSLLDALQPVFHQPILVFYPGDYNEYELRLFGKLPANPYYRAYKEI